MREQYQKSARKNHSFAIVGEFRSWPLTRQADEKAIRKSIEETVKNDLRIDPAHFRDFATAEWKDKIAETKKDIEKKLDLFEMYGHD